MQAPNGVQDIQRLTLQLLLKKDPQIIRVPSLNAAHNEPIGTPGTYNGQSISPTSYHQTSRPPVFQHHPTPPPTIEIAPLGYSDPPMSDSSKDPSSNGLNAPQILPWLPPWERGAFYGFLFESILYGIPIRTSFYPRSSFLSL